MGKRAKKGTEELHQTAKLLQQHGMSLQEIAKVLKYNVSTIQNWLDHPSYGAYAKHQRDISRKYYQSKKEVGEVVGAVEQGEEVLSSEDMANGNASPASNMGPVEIVLALQEIAAQMKRLADAWETPMLKEKNNILSKFLKS